MKNTNNNKETLEQLRKLDACPPFVAYALARKHTGGAVKRPTLDELVQRSGLSQRTFIRIAGRVDWADVKYRDLKAFLAACGVNPWRMKVHRRFLAHHAGKLPTLSKRQWEFFYQRSGEAYKRLNPLPVQR